MSQRDRVTMTDDEVAALVAEQHKLQLGTINPDGTPHLVTMFYASVDGKIGFWTYQKSQKMRNIERDPRVTCLIETGEDYFELRGALIYGIAKVLTDQNEIRYVGAGVVRRMMDIQDDDVAPFVDSTAAKRFAIIVEPVRVASWDHRKLT